MKKGDFKASPLWEAINQDSFTDEKTQNLDSFKSSEINYRLALWRPETNGIRYLKALIYLLCSMLSSADWVKMGKIKHKDFGNPIAVTFNKQPVCLDYIQSLLEMNFIAKNLTLNHKKIIEIGAGYGRTCHAIISNFNIKEYYIVDLKNCLRISQSYLKRVLTKEQFAKIKFFSNEDMMQLESLQFDLAINIDSFAEMDEPVVLNYMKYIHENCSYFYVKNPTGKYRDKTLDNHARGKRAVSHALRAGILRQFVDINDNLSVAKSAKKFLRAYRPSRSWKLSDSGWAMPWSYYWQAMYRKAK